MIKWLLSLFKWDTEEISMIKRLFIFTKNNNRNLVKTLEVRDLTSFFMNKGRTRLFRRNHERKKIIQEVDSWIF